MNEPHRRVFKTSPLPSAEDAAEELELMRDRMFELEEEVEELRRRLHACWRYFDHRRRTTVAYDPSMMRARMSLKREAEESCFDRV